MNFSLNLQKFSSLTSGLLMLGSLGVTYAQADESYSYLVSVQDSTGEHLCNGSYIGGNQVLFSPDCRSYNLTPFPIGSSSTPTSLDSSSVVIDGVATVNMPNIAPGVYSSNTSNFSASTLSDAGLVINGVPIDSIPDGGIIGGTPIDGGVIIPSPFPIPNYPVQVVFNLADGTQSASYPISQRMTHPFSGDDIIATVNTVPEGVETLTLASDALLDKLESGQDMEVKVVGRYYTDYTGEIGSKMFNIAPISECQNLTNNPLARRLCLVAHLSDPFPNCTIDVANKSTGAPVVYEAGSEKFLLGYKRRTTNFIESCDNWAAISQYTPWKNLMDAKQAGLSVATAYDLGERPLIARTKLNVTFTNHSADQKFDIFNADFVKGDHFSMSGNTCHTLLPSEECTIEVFANPQDPIKYEDLLSFEINGNAAGSYVVASAVGQHMFKGDRSSLWEIRGWVKNKKRFSGSIIADYEVMEQLTLKRNKYVVNPKNVSVTYRANGIDDWLMLLYINRKGLFGDGPSLAPVNTLAGTDNEWVTKTFEIEEPGTYEASISRGLFFNNQLDTEFNVEISNICFNDCSD